MRIIKIMEAQGGVGSYVRARRVARGLSLRALADRAGVSKSALSAWERGTHQPSMPELDAVLRVYGVAGEERASVLTLVDAPRARRELQRGAATSGLAPTVSGDLLRALRVRKGWSPSQAARALGVQPSTVARWEEGNIWPSPERVLAICDALGASPEERAVLAGAPTVTGIRRAADLDAIEQVLFKFRHWRWTGSPMPMVELELVGAVADLWPLMGKSAVAEDMYRQGCGFLACWMFISRGALDDAAHYARRALVGDNGQLPKHVTSWPAHILAKAAAFGGRRNRPQAGIAYLQAWMPRFSHNMGLDAWFRRDLAELVAASGDLSSALTISQRAREITCEAGDSVINADFDHACLLLRAGRPGEALPLLPRERNSAALQDAREALAWAEALVGVGERQEAERKLHRAETLIEGHGLAVLRPQRQALAACLS